MAKGPEYDNGIAVHRPAYLQVPRLSSAFWIDTGAFFWCRWPARKLHRQLEFDAILSFDLFGAGGLAWRIGHDLGIPAMGWATGSDVRKPAGSSLERVVTRAITRLDLVFYQSRELFEIGARLLGMSPEVMPNEKHVILSRGIPEAPSLPKGETRRRVRASLGIRNDQIFVLTVGSILREKGVFELLRAVYLAAASEPRIFFSIVGSVPALDHTRRVVEVIEQTPTLRDRVRILPACTPDKVWEYLCAADVFAFASHKEGMPNALLEAMAMGLPAIAFAIPPVVEIEASTGALVPVPPLNAALFAQALLRLAASPVDRERIGEKARQRVIEHFMLRNKMAEALRRIQRVVDQRRSSNAVKETALAHQPKRVAPTAGK